MFSTIFRFIVKLTGFIPAWIFFRCKTYFSNKQNKARIGIKSAILICNHTSALDYILLLFRYPFRKLRFIFGELVYKNKFNGWMSRRMGCIKVDKTIGDMSYMNEAVKCLNKGGVVGIFPEGHMIHDGKIDTFKPSVVYLALETGAPIIPIYTNGKYGFKHRTRINIGEKIYLRDYCDSLNPSKEEVDALCEMLQNKVKALQKQESQFEQFHTQNIFDFFWFVLDFVKAVSLFIIPKIYLVFPTKKYFAKGVRRNSLHIRGRGIIMSNHTGFIDPLMMHFFYWKRRIRVIAAEELFYKTAPIIRWFLKKIDCIEYRRISQSNIDVKMFTKCVNVLQANGVIGIFPEGHIEQVESDNQIRGGVVLMSLYTDSIIYPYYLLGQYKAFKRQKVIFGAPIDLKDYYEKGTPFDTKLVIKLTGILSQKMEELKKEGQSYLKK